MDTERDTLANRFRQQAREWPERPAVTDFRGTLRYGDVDGLARRTGRSLAEAGVVEGDRVALVAPASGRAVAAMLAILFRGAAYVPIDPAWPVSRRRQVVAAAAPRAVVTWTGQRPIVVPYAGEAPIAEGVESWAVGDIAYVIFTSGSTGAPKGVLIGHAGVLDLLDSFDDLAPVPDGFRASWWSAPTFDVSTWEVWSALCRGGHLNVAPPATRYDGAGFAAFLAERRIASCYVPPTFLTQLLARLGDDPGLAQGLVRMLVGVEPIPRTLLQDIMARSPRLTVINGYGPTEATVCCTAHVVPRAPRAAGRTPIGRPVGRMTAWIVPVGNVDGQDRGELVVAGPGVAFGYLAAGREEAGRFGRRQLGGTTVRTFRTGDLVRRQPDGELVFIGRRDRQLKVRGVRVEPAEVERAALAHPGVTGAAVVPRVFGGAAFGLAVLAATGEADERSVDRHLRESLPRAMVPDVVQVVDAFPMTGHGKIDHAVLRRDIEAGAATAGSVAARLPDRGVTGADLVRACRAVAPALRDAATDLVEAGMSSFGAAVVAEGLRRSGYQIGGGEVLAAGSCARLARRLASPGAGPARPVLTEAPLSPWQRGIWLHEQMAGVEGLYHERLGFEIRDRLDPGALAAAVTSAARRHAAFGAVVDATVPYRPVFRLAGHPPAVRIVDASDRDLDAAVLDASAEPLAAADSPLMRAVIGSSAERTCLVLAWHHLVVDGTSTRIFLSDLAEQLCGDDPGGSTNPSGPTYCDLVEAQRSRSVTSSTDDRAAAIAGLVAGIPLAGDLPRAAASGQVRTAELPADLIRSLGVATGRAGHPWSTPLVCAYQWALATVLDRDALIVGLAVDTRAGAAERVAGCFINSVLVPYRRIAGGGGAGPRLEEVRLSGRSLRAALRDRDIPLSAVMPKLAGIRDIATAGFPPFYLSVDQAYELDLRRIGRTARRLPVPPAPQKFPVELVIEVRDRAPCPVRLRVRPGVRDGFAGRLLETFTAALHAMRTAVST